MLRKLVCVCVCVQSNHSLGSIFECRPKAREVVTDRITPRYTECTCPVTFSRPRSETYRAVVGVGRGRELEGRKVSTGDWKFDVPMNTHNNVPSVVVSM